LTDSIKNWIKHENTGSTAWAKFAYNNVTRAITKACFTNYKGNMPLSKNNFRDKVDDEELYLLTRMELLAAEIIWDIDKKFPESDAKEKQALLSQRLLMIGDATKRINSTTIQELFETTDKTSEH